MNASLIPQVSNGRRNFAKQVNSVNHVFVNTTGLALSIRHVFSPNARRKSLIWTIFAGAAGTEIVILFEDSYLSPLAIATNEYLALRDRGYLIYNGNLPTGQKENILNGYSGFVSLLTNGAVFIHLSEILDIS